MVNTQGRSETGKLGKVITFYSYKGGVGRSLALANVAALIAKWGRKVLVIDWDLEAPGLENFYRKFLDIQQVAAKEGIIDLLMLGDKSAGTGTPSIDWSKYITQLNGELSYLWIMTSGKKGDDYPGKVRSFNISRFFQEKDGGKFLEGMRDYGIREFDFIFIDSRTGLTDSSGICSIHMPDVLALLFTPNEQSFKGSLEVANKAAAAHARLMYDRLKLKLFPIPTRIENNESVRREEWLDRFSRELTSIFDWLPRKKNDITQFVISPGDLIQHIKVPYLPEYAYGEQLPAIEKGTSNPQDIGWVYETIASIFANDFDSLEFLKDSRDQYIKKARREEIVDHSDYERRIEIEREEKRKLEESIQKRQARTTRRILASVVGVLLLGIAGYFIWNNNASSQSVAWQQEQAYKSFTASYDSLTSTAATPKYNGVSTLSLLTLYNKYFSLPPEYREKASGYKRKLDSSMQPVLSERIRTLYNSLADTSYSLALFTDTLIQFDSAKDVATRSIFSNKAYLKYLDDQRRNSRGKDVGTVHSLKGDSGSFTIQLSEGAYSLFPEKNKPTQSLVELVFNYDLKVTAALPFNRPVRLITPPVIDSARIFVLSGNKDTSSFESLRSDLLSAGFMVLGSKYLLDLGRPDLPEIRYFNMADKQQAEKLGAYMQAKIANSVYPANKYTDPKARAGYIEIWMGR